MEITSTDENIKRMATKTLKRMASAKRKSFD